MASKARSAVAIVVGLLIMGLLAAVLMPTVVGAFVTDDSQTVTQAEGETVELSQDLEATVDTVDDEADEVTVTVANDDDTATVTVAEGQTERATVDGTDVDVTTESIVDGTTAEVSYEWPTSYGWGAASNIWVLIPLFLILPIFMFFTAVAIRQY